jgi:hypothetical protein
MRRPPFDASHEVADGDTLRNLHEHMDMLFGQYAGDDLYAEFFADLSDDRSYPISQSAFQHFVAIFRDPDDVVAVVKNGVTSGCVAHRLEQKAAKTWFRTKETDN